MYLQPSLRTPLFRVPVFRAPITRVPVLRTPDWLADAIERLWDRFQVRRGLIFSYYLIGGLCALLGYYVALVAVCQKAGYELVWMFLVWLVTSNRRRTV